MSMLDITTLRSFRAYLGALQDSSHDDAINEVVDSLLAARPGLPDRLDFGSLTLFCDRIDMVGRRRAIARSLFRGYRDARKRQGW